MTAGSIKIDKKRVEQNVKGPKIKGMSEKRIRDTKFTFTSIIKFYSRIINSENNLFTNYQ